MDIPTPTRLVVLQRLGAVIETTAFPTAEDPTFTLAGRVFRGRNLTGEESKPWPIVSILESPRPDIGIYAAEDAFMRHDKWTLLINGMIQHDLLNPCDDAYWLCAAVEQSLGKINARKSSGSAAYPEFNMLGGLITSLEIAPPVVRPPGDKASAAAFFFLPVRVGIATPVGQPYTPVAP